MTFTLISMGINGLSTNLGAPFLVCLTMEDDIPCLGKMKRFGILRCQLDSRFNPWWTSAGVCFSLGPTSDASDLTRSGLEQWPSLSKKSGFAPSCSNFYRESNQLVVTLDGI